MPNQSLLETRLDALEDDIATVQCAVSKAKERHIQIQSLLDHRPALSAAYHALRMVRSGVDSLAATAAEEANFEEHLRMLDLLETVKGLPPRIARALVRQSEIAI